MLPELARINQSPHPTYGRNPSERTTTTAGQQGTIYAVLVKVIRARTECISLRGRTSLQLTGVTLLGIGLMACPNNKAQAPTPKVMTKEGKMAPLKPQDEKLGALAIDVLARDLKVPKDTIRVDTIRPVEWRDSSTGCPEPGQAYLQVITPGHKITLRVGKKLYFVHEANGRAIVCKRKKVIGGITDQHELVWGAQVLQARKDLATKLGVSEREIRFSAAEERTWPDRSLGCPEAGVAYSPGKVEGYVLILRHKQRDYTYHTDLKRVFACPQITED